MAGWTWCWTAGCARAGNTTVDITDPVWRMIRQGAITEREVLECLG